MDSKAFSTKAIPQTDRVIRFIISDETTDREGDVLIAAGCDFSEFQKNPQFLGFHDYRDFPMGIPKSWGVDTRAKNVWMNVYFPTLDELSTDPDHASEKAKQVDTVYNMYKLGMLNAVSVGFRVKDAEPIENSYGKKILKWELMEVSAVPIPCNPNAVVEARAIKSFDPKMVDEMEKAMEVDKKAGARFSKETMAAHAEIQGKIRKCHDDYMTKCNTMHKEHKAEMAGYMDMLESFMASGSPGGEEEGGDAEGSAPKGLDIEKVSEYLRKSGKE